MGSTPMTLTQVGLPTRLTRALVAELQLAELIAADGE